MNIAKDGQKYVYRVFGKDQTTTRLVQMLRLLRYLVSVWSRVCLIPQMCSHSLVN